MTGLLRRPVLMAFVGMLLAQAAWVLAVPAYEAIDEFDHAYRAAGVARGEWRLTESAGHGSRGELTTVPGGMVEAAREQCQRLRYTGPANCTPVARLPGGDVRISTAAGSYNPVYYWVVGTAALPFDGDVADYVLRATSALVCALAIAVAVWCLGVAGAGPWTRLGLLASLTPVLVYTTVVPAPNSVEIVAGLCLWTGLLALASDGIGRRAERLALLVTTVAGCVIVVPRMLGPGWLALIVLVAVVFVGPARVRDVVRRQPRLFAASFAVQCLAVAYAAWWTLSAGLTRPSPGEASLARSAGLTAEESVQPVAWMLETVAAFPFRDQPAPLPVYAIVFVVVAAMLGTGLRVGRGRERIAILAAVALSVLVPSVLSYLTAESQGAIWQGRYALPLVVGILLMCGLAMDRAGWAPVERGRLVVLGLLMLVVAHAWSVAHVAHAETSPATAVVTALLTVLGWIALGSVTAPRAMEEASSPVRVPA